jgi:putative hemolysin
VLNSVLPKVEPSGLIVPSFHFLPSDHLTLKIAETAEEIRAAQELRYQVFYEEMGAIPTEEMKRERREIDPYDPFCQHLLVIGQSITGEKKIVGTYRLLTLEDARLNGVSLYTETEFDISKLKATGKRIMEVSRSCVLEAYRSKMAINLLWRGICDFVVANKIDYLIGIPSLQGTDLSAHEQTLAYLKAYHLAEEQTCPRALEEYYNAMPDLDKSQIDVKREFIKLPPLLKGYLRVGAVVGDGAFIDHQFNTVDVVIIVEIDKIDPRYLDRYMPKNA